MAISAFCDALWLYANIKTYFTPNENYSRCKGGEQIIRKCDVRIDTPQSVALHPQELEQTVYRGCKEYDPGYVWGQLIGWFKQTVDKPNASLSADRRGTLSMPDLESFLVTPNMLQPFNDKQKLSDYQLELDEESPELKLLKKHGTKSRPMDAASEMALANNNDIGEICKKEP